MQTVRLPARFFDDHGERLGDEGLHETGRSRNGQVEVMASDAGLKALLGDAAFYADPRCMTADENGCPRAVIESAKRTVSAIKKQAPHVAALSPRPEADADRASGGGV